MLCWEAGQRHSRKKRFQMRWHRTREMPFFTSEALDTLRRTDYTFLTPGPADIILSLVAESDFCALLSSPADSVGEKYYIRGASWIPPFLVVVSVTFSIWGSAAFTLYNLDVLKLPLLFSLYTVFTVYVSSCDPCVCCLTHSWIGLHNLLPYAMYRGKTMTAFQI